MADYLFGVRVLVRKVFLRSIPNLPSYSVQVILETRLSLVLVSYAPDRQQECYEGPSSERC